MRQAFRRCQRCRRRRLSISPVRTETRCIVIGSSAQVVVLFVCTVPTVASRSRQPLVSPRHSAGQLARFSLAAELRVVAGVLFDVPWLVLRRAQRNETRRDETTRDTLSYQRAVTSPSLSVCPGWLAGLGMRAAPRAGLLACLATRCYGGSAECSSTCHATPSQTSQSTSAVSTSRKKRRRQN
ncbi:hypothetical protein IWX90DRAFT_81700 [Phyllosticta citrichinensis]|uniref:Uncharacterized protein n=1 Tax=Phyllosticta citrichinensis TaxID=1130410 RepID=A0ABR1XG14_9PEZI